MQDYGLASQYVNDDEFAVQVQMLPALAYVPANFVESTFDLIKSVILQLPVHQRLVTYFEKAYVGKVLRYNRNVAVREKVRFPVVEWNVHESVLRDVATTNNNVEAFHRGMHAIMPQSHPAFYKCLDKLLLLQRKSDNECARADHNHELNF